MTLRTLTLAAVTALAAAVPSPASSAVITAPANACTSLSPICALGCSADSVVHIQVVGYGYGDVTCGGHTWCETVPFTSSSDVGTCHRAAYVTSDSTSFSCRVDPYGSIPTVAYCWSEPSGA